MWPKIINGILTREGISERELADRCGVKQPTINRLRTGKTRNPAWPLGECLIDLAAGSYAPAASHDHQEAA
jgi:transcriptional regulator with XRE-family HTH domain